MFYFKDNLNCFIQKKTMHEVHTSIINLLFRFSSQAKTFYAMNCLCAFFTVKQNPKIALEVLLQK